MGELNIQEIDSSNLAAGNDCPGNRVFTCTPYSGWAGTQTALEFLHGHGMIPDSKKAEIDAACGSWYERAPPGPYEAPPDKCAALLEDKVRPVKSFAGDTYDMGGGYFLYDTCGNDGATTRNLLTVDRETGLPKEAEPAVPTAVGSLACAAPDKATDYPLDAGEYACGQENAAGLWLNTPEVQSALHVKLVGKSRFAFSTGRTLDLNRGPRVARALHPAVSCCCSQGSTTTSPRGRCCRSTTPR